MTQLNLSPVAEAILDAKITVAIYEAWLPVYEGWGLTMPAELTAGYAEAKRFLESQGCPPLPRP